MIADIVDINRYCVKIRLNKFKEIIVDITLRNASIHSCHAVDIDILKRCPFSMQVKKS